MLDRSFIALRIVVTVKARVIAEAREDGKSSLICDDGPNGGFGGSNKIRDVRIIMTMKLLCSYVRKIYAIVYIDNGYAKMENFRLMWF